MLPEAVLLGRKSDVDERPPFWPLWFTDQTHVCFTRKPIVLARIAADARADHVFPRRGPTVITRHHVVEIEFAPIKRLAALLAGVLIVLSLRGSELQRRDRVGGSSAPSGDVNNRGSAA